MSIHFAHYFCRSSRLAVVVLAGLLLGACGGGKTGDTQTANNDQPPQAGDSGGPTVSISPRSDTTTSAIVMISGTASDDVGVTQVAWSVDGGDSGTASGTESWTAGVVLRSGANVITVTARDATNRIGTATITVTYDDSDTVSGRDWFVDANGNQQYPDTDPNAGTEAMPFQALTSALAVAMPGDRVIVKAGDYTDPNATWYSAFTPANSGTETAPIRIVSDPPLAAVLVPRDFSETPLPPDPDREEYPAMAIYGRSHIIVDGFLAKGHLRIQHSGVNPEQGVYNLPQHVTFQNCEVLYGSKEGTDNSLNYGIVIHSSNFNTLRNNLVHDMRSSGNNSSNTAAIMLFASAYNLIENNDADAGNGTVYSAFGQKAGQIHHNFWRRNVARNAVVGFLGKGGTGGTSYADHETYYQNIVVDSEIAFNLNHNSRYWRVYNNTVYNVNFFMNQWQLSSVDNRFWNNVVAVADDGAYQIEDLGSPDWSPYISHSDYNFFGSVANTFARWQFGSGSYSFGEWRSNTGYDLHSLEGDPLFVSTTPGSYDFRLQAGSPAGGAGSDGQDMGAYPTGSEVIGYSPP